MLAIPAIPDAIPVSLVPAASQKRTALLAHALLGAGMINVNTLPARLNADLHATTKEALDAWIKLELEGLRCFWPMFNIHLGTSVEVDGVRSGKPYGEIAVFARGGRWNVGDKLQSLESAKAGLGALALRMIGKVSDLTLPIYTPTDVREMASYLYWYGEADESEAIAMSCDSGEDEAAMRADMVTAKMMQDTYPEWSMRDGEQRKSMSAATLKRTVGHLPERWMREVARDVLALMAVDLPKRNVPTDETFVGWGGLLVWGDGDQLTGRVVDDFEQSVWDNGEDCYEESCSWAVGLDSPDEMADWVAKMQPWFQALRTLDALIFKLTQGD